MQIAKVEIRYEDDGKTYTFSPNGFDLKPNDAVVVDTVRGSELGYVSSEITYVDELELKDKLKNVLRLATDKDIAQKKENLEKQKEIKAKTETLAEKLKLDMKIVSAELNLERSKVIINFTSDDRVDFRELVKELASCFKIRIEQLL